MENRNLAKALIGFLMYVFLVPALLFIAAGTLRWPMAWVYTAALLASTLLSRLVVLIKNPDTLQERANFTSTENTEKWDRLLVMWVGLFGPMLLMVVAGLDHRYGWSGGLPRWLQSLGAVLVIAGYGVAVWAMIVNKYFSAVVRIQEDRGHTVVKRGPYRLVRHPAYAGAVWAGLAFPLMLDTLWVFIPAVVLVGAVLVRTAKEDDMLKEKLAGYKAYSAETRYRIFPGIW
ncbi:MAG TPA: isoprenylcysteine carboxylmethyltransferase family protein [Anaerolineales bacterium]|nr:isoprenylcysteine carboxylmethyltransferase family protein [Anaerolineales bacterium]